MARKAMFYTREDQIAEKVVAMLYVRGIVFGKYRQTMIKRIAKAIRVADRQEPRS